MLPARRPMDPCRVREFSFLVAVKAAGRALLVSATLILAASAQTPPAVEIGTINHLSAPATLDGVTSDWRTHPFPVLRAGSVLRTGSGAAEVLLAPGSVLRVGEYSSVRMISSDVDDIVLELVDGTAALEVIEFLERSPTVIVVNGAETKPAKKGLYGFRASRDTLGELRIYRGVAEVTQDSKRLKATRRNVVRLRPGSLQRDHFNGYPESKFLRWCVDRSEVLAQANVDVAYKSERTGIGQWRFNRYSAVYTFVPADGRVFSPYVREPYWSARTAPSGNEERNNLEEPEPFAGDPAVDYTGNLFPDQ